MHCRLGFLNIVVSHKDIVTVSQYHRYRKLLARATQELLFTDIFELVKEREPFTESHNVISYGVLILSSFNHLQVSHLRRCSQTIKKLLDFMCSLQHMVQSPCSLDNIKQLEPSNS